KVDIALPRGSAVSGRILDEFGEPVADASVSAMRREYASGKRRLVQSGRNSLTNDLGQFRLFGLPPGEYYISVTMRTFDSMVMLMSSMKDAVQFMPGGTSQTDKDGNFTLSNVAPGEYTIQVQSLAALMSQATQAMALIGGGEPGKDAAPTQVMEREFAMANVN